MKYLIVAAHPDDEALGAGAMIHKAAVSGDKVYVCLLSHWSPTRDDDLEDGIRKSHQILGVKKSYVGDFGCMRFKDADHHEMVRFIESCIKDCRPDILVTHHPADIHIDHGVVAECCMEAAKLPQRQICNIPPIKNICFMEVPSSTDWNINSTLLSFTANLFVSVSEDDIEAKLSAVDIYENVLRKPPHPRSITGIQALATVRGASCGVELAEAFQSVFQLEV